jgi:hypothetical protein
MDIGIKEFQKGNMHRIIVLEQMFELTWTTIVVRGNGGEHVAAPCISVMDNLANSSFISSSSIPVEHT